MALPTRLIVSGAVAGLALTYYVRRRHARTGEGYLDIVRQLPGDAVRWAEGTRERATRALEEGKAAARARDTEFVQQLQAVNGPPAG